MKNTLRKLPIQRNFHGKSKNFQTVTVNFTLSPQRGSKATQSLGGKEGESGGNQTENLARKKVSRGQRIESNMTGLCLRVKSKG